MRIYQFTVHGTNLDPELCQYQSRVFAHFGMHVNILSHDFGSLSHHTDGANKHAEAVAKAICDNSGADVFVLWDADCIPLVPGVTRWLINKSFGSLVGVAQQSNHINVDIEPVYGLYRWCGYCGINQTSSLKCPGCDMPTLEHDVEHLRNHVYIGPACMVIPRYVLSQIFLSGFDEFSLAAFLRCSGTGDAFENLSWQCEKLGISQCFLWPSSCEVPKWDLGVGSVFGYGTTYSNVVYHAFSGNKDRFIAKCKQILGECPDHGSGAP